MGVSEAIGLTKFLRNEQIKLLLYGWVTARRDCEPSENWKDTISEFKRRFGIHEEIDCDEAMYSSVFRMTADLLNEGI